MKRSEFYYGSPRVPRSLWYVFCLLAGMTLGVAIAVWLGVAK
jgi:hypothetical protein